jgi:hypothetical protein
MYLEDSGMTRGELSLKEKLQMITAEALQLDLNDALEIAKNAKDRSRLFEQVITKANAGVLITSANSESPEIIFVNEEFTRITGYQPHEVIGKTPRFLQGEKTDKATLQRLKNCLIAGEPFQGEIINYSKSGHEYWLDINLVPIKDESGKVTHFAALERDITEKKDFEKQLLRAKEYAEETNKAKSEFLANMSHELRTPMNGIIGMCELLMDTSLNGDQKEMAKTLRSSSENLLTMLNDILDISKVESGDLKLEDVAFDVSIAVSEMIQLFTPVAMDKKLKLEAKISDNVPTCIMGDPGRLQQILRNLITNALKFTEVGGITINVNVSNQRGLPEIYFQVKDTGIGVPEEKLEAIFQKFTQADTSITRRYGGTGLGLAITKQLVEMMGGIIGVESTVGYGSIFYFCIPIKAAPENAVPVNVIPDFEKRDVQIATNVKVLAVDDHPINRMFIDKLLRKMGIRNIEFAENGLDAILMLKVNKYDMVFMDCQMPEMDGYTATRHIRKNEDKDSHIPIIAMTANAMVGDREKCLAAGMDDYISKPVKADKLRKILEKWTNEVKPTAAETAEEIVQENIARDATAAVDMEHLAMYTDGDKEQEKELFGIFLEQADICIKVLDDNVIGGSCEQWRKSSHKLKGAAATLGAHKLAELCKDAESSYLETSERKLELKAYIESELKKVREFLNKQ